MLIDDRDVRVIEFGQGKGKFQAAAPNNFSHGFETRPYVSPLPTGNDRLCLADDRPELGLGEPSAEPGLSYQVSGHHVVSIVHICYIYSF